MPDNKLKTAADRKRINVRDHQELHYWSHRFGVSPEELKRAVSKAGVMADDVARVLGKLWLLNTRIHRRTTLQSELRRHRAPGARFFQKRRLVGAFYLKRWLKSSLLEYTTRVHKVVPSS